MDWQPIETAPKDDIWVLLCGGAIRYGWDANDQPSVVAGQRVVNRSNFAADAGWQFAWYDSGYYGEYEGPTHWMPLPALPTPQ